MNLYEELNASPCVTFNTGCENGRCSELPAASDDGFPCCLHGGLDAQSASPAGGQIDLNAYCRFPFSLGPFGKDFNIFGVQAAFRLPLPRLLWRQPIAQLSYSQFDDRAPDTWSHQLYAASLGLGWANGRAFYTLRGGTRLSKEGLNWEGRPF